MAALVLWLTAGCGSNERPPQDEPNPSQQPSTQGKSDGAFEDVFQDIVTAFQGGEYAEIDRYIGEEVFVVYPSGGMYPDFVAHPSFTAVAEDPSLAEPIRYLLQAMSSMQGLDGTLTPTDLSEVDPCDVQGITYMADEATTTVLTTTYKQLQENIGEEGQSPIFKRLLDAESTITMQVYVGTGEEADVMYFAPSGKSWQLVALDLSECGM